MEPPPLLGELLQRLAAGVERDEVAGAATAADLGLERLSVCLAVEGPERLGSSYVSSSSTTLPTGSHTMTATSRRSSITSTEGEA